MVRDMFVNLTILITFISLGFHLFHNTNLHPTTSPIRLKILFGLVSGSLGCILIDFSVGLRPNVYVDLRIIPILIAAIYGGIYSSVVASLVTGVFRYSMYENNIHSVIAIIVLILIGIISPIVAGKTEDMKKKWVYATVTGCIIGSVGLGIAVKPSMELVWYLLIYWSGSMAIAHIFYAYIDFLTESLLMFKKYKKEATIDFLTGLNNVRQFDKIYNEMTIEIGSGPMEEHFSLLFMDIDHFKRINDTYGHTEGDKILKEVAKLLLLTCRDKGIVFRNGGEEFSVILPDYPLKEALEVAEKIRTRVEKHPFVISELTLQVTLSIGVAAFPDITRDFGELIERADKALYLAKQSGRNKVMLDLEKPLEMSE